MITDSAFSGTSLSVISFINSGNADVTVATVVFFDSVEDVSLFFGAIVVVSILFVDGIVVAGICVLDSGTILSGVSSVVDDDTVAAVVEVVVVVEGIVVVEARAVLSAFNSVVVSVVILSVFVVGAIEVVPIVLVEVVVAGVPVLDSVTILSDVDGDEGAVVVVVEVLVVAKVVAVVEGSVVMPVFNSVVVSLCFGVILSVFISVEGRSVVVAEFVLGIIGLLLCAVDVVFVTNSFSIVLSCVIKDLVGTIVLVSATIVVEASVVFF